MFNNVTCNHNCPGVTHMLTDASVKPGVKKDEP